MSRESKIFNFENNNVYVWDLQQTVQHYESFGWELLTVNGDQVSMTRETQNPKYAQLVNYEHAYEENINKIKQMNHSFKPNNYKVKFKTALILLLLFIFPGVIYIVVTNKKSKEIKTYNENLKNEINNLVAETDQLCKDSRDLFFSQN